MGWAGRGAGPTGLAAGPLRPQSSAFLRGAEPSRAEAHNPLAASAQPGAPPLRASATLRPHRPGYPPTPGPTAPPTAASVTPKRSRPLTSNPRPSLLATLVSPCPLLLRFHCDGLENREEREWRDGAARKRLPSPVPDTLLGLPDHPAPILRLRGPTRPKMPVALVLSLS